MLSIERKVRRKKKTYDVAHIRRCREKAKGFSAKWTLCYKLDSLVNVLIAMAASKRATSRTVQNRHSWRTPEAPNTRIRRPGGSSCTAGGSSQTLDYWQLGLLWPFIGVRVRVTVILLPGAGTGAELVGRGERSNLHMGARTSGPMELRLSYRPVPGCWVVSVFLHFRRSWDKGVADELKLTHTLIKRVHIYHKIF